MQDATKQGRRRLGVFGGTFDPIHNGHLRLAEEAREQLNLAAIVFVPNVQSPFKADRVVSPADVRLELLRVAVGDNPHFAVSDVEIRRGGVSYTIDTLRMLLAESREEISLTFLTGSDALRDMMRWRSPHEIFRLAEVGAAIRPGVSREESLSELPEALRGRVHFVQMPALAISATDIRRRAGAGLSVRYLVPLAVERRIVEQKLYRPDVAERNDDDGRAIEVSVNPS